MPVLPGKWPLASPFVTAFVDTVGYGILVPLPPFYVGRHDVGRYATGAVTVGLPGSLYAAMHRRLPGARPDRGGFGLMAGPAIRRTGPGAREPDGVDRQDARKEPAQ